MLASYLALQAAMFSGVLGSLAAYLAGGPPSAMRSTTLRDAGACGMHGSCDQAYYAGCVCVQLLTQKAARGFADAQKTPN